MWLQTIRFTNSACGCHSVMLLLAYDTTNIARQHFSLAQPLARHDGCILRVVGGFATLPPQRIPNRSLRLQLNAYLFGVHIARRMVAE